MKVPLASLMKATPTNNGNFILVAVMFLLLMIPSILPGCLQEADESEKSAEIEEPFWMTLFETDASGLPDGGHANEVTVKVNPTNPNNVVVGGNDYHTPAGDVWVGVYTSFDGGETFTRVLLPCYAGDTDLGCLTTDLTLSNGAGDPVLAFGPEGELYMAGIAFWRTFVGKSIIFVARSDDGGLTWPASQISTVAVGEGAVAFHDKEWIEVDQESGTAYITWAVFSGLTSSNIMFARSDNGGGSWTTRTIITDVFNYGESQGTIPKVMPDGSLSVIWIDYATEMIVLTRSEDKGDSWTTPIPIAVMQEGDREMTGNNFRTPTLPAMHVDLWPDSPYHGRTYITWHGKNYFGDRADIVLVWSDDLETWSEPILVNQDKWLNESGDWEATGVNISALNDQWFPSVASGPEGTVHIAFYDRRDDPDNTFAHIYHAWSVDGGENWTDKIATTVSFNGNWASGSRTGQVTGEDVSFIGDYTEIAVGEDNVAHFGYCDARKGTDNNRQSGVFTLSFNYSMAQPK